MAAGLGEFVEAAVLLERDGLAPVAGGSSDQAAWFLEALAVWHRERAAIDRRQRQTEEGSS